ncbi:MULTISPECIES: metalloregulator ArsR/SmtB family transcription factor [unclassified Fibrobacter]|uniref:ArsR/SmtB family transcription factor n=1 Tax=unclassified Fibrobacter TaxID=2634177 RepID=UPI000D799C31|nr:MULTISPECIES: metalloregulator ArsR/SmtB family transcription factor [unclassified Fibrobacter]PWJ69040.1 ArsR family transcriptional regulator [Fibrobacter sp. UWR4]PZW72871.1 ArsR family transcriptional regulator [Fibrobacter sp. UWR1]
MAKLNNNREPIVPNMDLFGAISDEMRLKILLLLDQAEFTVNEIKDILDIHQSNASRHLAKLSSCNLLKDRRDGIKAYYRLSEDLYLSDRMLSMIREAYEELPDKDVLKCRAAQVLEDRSDKTKGLIHKLDQAGGSLKAQVSLFSKLMVQFDNAVDVGCGEGGDLSLMLSSRCKHVTSLDCDPKVVSGLQQILKQKGIQNVQPKMADMVNTGLPDDFADLVLMSQVLHHAMDPRLALKEAVRILKPGGTLALLDLAQHKEESFRTTHGHIWLGFDRSQLEFFVQELNCDIVESEIIPSENEVDKKLPVICMILTKNG